MNRVALFLNGQAPKIFPDLNQFEVIFCTDGAYRYLQEKGIKPDVVSGDFDSLSPNEILTEIEIVETPDQNFTDFEKALQIIQNRNFHDVYIYGSSGMEHDHFLGNLSTGLKYKDKLNLVFFDDYSYYFFSEKETVLEDYKGRIISLYPFPVAKNIFTEGLLYGLNNEDLDLSQRIGIRNQAVKNKVSIKYDEGELLIFIKKD
ncbi:thiamine diphosphokinase [Moheibacter sediminis]|uniref:Thiamine diphosphokinase n=1 Tax=Moheibacter sediminis TaxID=1434700 RepID=A0A1W1ZBL9_9FLAO|nr:thiamine diphosphokinase [Moheibacter sediminis]SMC45662.1 thiamine pyrophosphokinase [Moheibacter sediminis]